ncbi:hypothetical protein N7462_007831 [Penicillium macrosclerotiorum]|uniref:uncharacterized protein n=1 Tax=Penicillium macrosclerotiorum TaxID=303699 RepID=UPI002546FDA0|nr:uncharacterized protein N7462_007831 [Penicillium macrosclerotiorum]KAJ5679587.1 hypothetical protein N7462_007831 [Penicillium macrosclerotiorum]
MPLVSEYQADEQQTGPVAFVHGLEASSDDGIVPDEPRPAQTFRALTTREDNAHLPDSPAFSS